MSYTQELIEKLNNDLKDLTVKGREITVLLQRLQNEAVTEVTYKGSPRKGVKHAWHNRGVSKLIMTILNTSTSPLTAVQVYKAAKKTGYTGKINSVSSILTQEFKKGTVDRTKYNNAYIYVTSK